MIGFDLFSVSHVTQLHDLLKQSKTYQSLIPRTYSNLYIRKTHTQKIKGQKLFFPIPQTLFSIMKYSIGTKGCQNNLPHPQF